MGVKAISLADGHLRNMADSFQNVFLGEEHLVTYPGTSQYSQGASSACGLAALNCVRQVLDLELKGVREDKLLQAMTERKFMDEVLSVCASWPSTSHLELEEIHGIPIFQATLRLVSSDYGKPGVAKFKEMLRQLNQIGRKSSAGRSCAVVVTRPPEIVVCMMIAHSRQDVYVVFDSHPRPKHPQGSAFIFNASLEKTAKYLAELLQFDEKLLSDSGLQWQAQLLANVSGHFFESTGFDLTNTVDAHQVLLNANLGLLALKAEITQLKSQDAFLAAENKRLNEELESVELELDELKAEHARYKGKAAERPPATVNACLVTENRQLNNEIAALQGPMNKLKTAPPSCEGRVQQYKLTIAPDKQESSRTASSTRLPFIPANCSYNPLTHIDACQPTTSRAIKFDDKDTDLQRNLLLATQLQQEFAEEDTLLRSQLSDLTKTAQVTFKCAICMDEQPEDFIVRIEQCGHPFCRDCLRQQVESKINEHRFPILCPLCVTQTNPQNPGTITNSLIELLGLSAKDCETFVELQLAGISTLLHCRKCKESAFVDRTDYQEAKLISCPLKRGCNHLWCKSCQQSVEIGGAEHSCDGSSELDHLMNRRGWKYCPGCRTPTEKTDGCNHMACMSPGCNTHFCYVCGNSIVQSALQREIQSAVSAHYRRCVLFEYAAALGRGLRR